jgi:hypothetical protein
LYPDRPRVQRRMKRSRNALIKIKNPPGAVRDWRVPSSIGSYEPMRDASQWPL